MQDTAVHNAKRLQSQLEAELDALNRQIREKTADLDRVVRFLAEVDAFAQNDLELVAAADEGHRAKYIPNSKREDVVAAAAHIIRTHGVPVSLRSLLTELRKQGYEINGANPSAVLNTMLWRSKDVIVRLPEHGYWIAELPYPMARYYPSASHAPNTEMSQFHDPQVHWVVSADGTPIKFSGDGHGAHMPGTFGPDRPTELLWNCHTVNTPGFVSGSFPPAAPSLLGSQVPLVQIYDGVPRYTYSTEVEQALTEAKARHKKVSRT